VIGRVTVCCTKGKVPITTQRVIDLHNWRDPQQYWVGPQPCYPQFGVGTRVGFDLAVNVPALYATNLRVPTEEDLKLLP
jgi:hypothetical protein